MFYVRLSFRYNTFMQQKRKNPKIFLYGAVIAAVTYAVSRKPVTKPKAAPVHTAAAPAKKKTASVFSTWLMWMMAIFCYAAANTLWPHTLPLARGRLRDAIKITLQEIPASKSVNDHFLHLQEDIASILQQEEGDWSVYVCNLDTEEEFCIHDEPMPSAALIRLFTAGAYLDKTEKQEIEYTEWDESNLYYMLVHSSDVAMVSLETTIGQGSYEAGCQAVTEFAHALGCSSTERLVQEDAENGVNVTKARDVGMVLKMLLRGNYVSPQASETILNYLYQQNHTDTIPADNPQDEAIAVNNMQELITAENEAAIVSGEKANYILVVLSDGVDSAHAQEVIQRLSETVYAFSEEKGIKNTPAKPASPTKNADQ